MDIGKFIDEYSKAQNEQTMVRILKKHITNDYIDYATKIAEAVSIIDKTCYLEINGKKKFVLNTPMRYMLFMTRVIANYTDLEFDKENTELQFNLLEKYGIFDIMPDLIGEDYNRFQTVVNMTISDVMENERSFISWIDNMGDIVSIFLDEVVKQIDTNNIVADENK